MTKYTVNVIWNHGFEHDYTIMGNKDIAQAAVIHLESITHLRSFRITDEEGEVFHESARPSVEVEQAQFH